MCFRVVFYLVLSLDLHPGFNVREKGLVKYSKSGSSSRAGSEDWLFDDPFQCYGPQSVEKQPELSVEIEGTFEKKGKESKKEEGRVGAKKRPGPDPDLNRDLLQYSSGEFQILQMHTKKPANYDALLRLAKESKKEEGRVGSKKSGIGHGLIRSRTGTFCIISPPYTIVADAHRVLSDLLWKHIPLLLGVDLSLDSCTILLFPARAGKVELLEIEGTLRRRRKSRKRKKEELGSKRSPVVSGEGGYSAQAKLSVGIEETLRRRRKSRKRKKEELGSKRPFLTGSTSYYMSAFSLGFGYYVSPGTGRVILLFKTSC
ncbi:hypothetical protein C8R44DRAFT_733267 [Mycena epipterygia]|nr:hypothetical protein C8R44DRAFT_733267 [Mycena epipterygia]